MEAETLAMAQEIDFSFFGLFARATLVVKIVMIMLIGASFWAWSVIVIKLILYRKTQREAAAFDRAFWSGEPLDGLFADVGPAPSGGAEKIFAAGMVEWQRSHHDDGGLIAGATQRIDRSMDVAINKESEYLRDGLTILATIGSSTPFMNAFIEIAEQQNTNLAVVAPGIAEALLATGLGLFAAIPAVIFYNKLSSDADKILAGYESFADEFATILSRQLDG